MLRMPYEGIRVEEFFGVAYCIGTLPGNPSWSLTVISLTLHSCGNTPAKFPASSRRIMSHLPHDTHILCDTYTEYDRYKNCCVNLDINLQVCEKFPRNRLHSRQ
jgi:hypothetical protein